MRRRTCSPLHLGSVTRCVILASTLLAVPLRPAASQGAAAEGPDAREIRARREASNAAIAKHDTAGIGASFAPGVVVLSSASSLSTGREANLRSFAGIFAERPDVVYRRTPREVRIFAPWSMASEEGTWTGSWTASDGRVQIGGRYFAKWRRIGGAWLIESETYVPERCTGSSFCAAAP